MINPRYPAPNRARMEVCCGVFNAIMRALAAPLPDRVIAGGYDSTVSFSLNRLDGDSFRVCMEVFGGGYGASSTADGCDAVDSPLSNCANTPVESLDMEYPQIGQVAQGRARNCVSACNFDPVFGVIGIQF